MKKLSFKSLESSYIKRICKSWLLIGLVTAFCVSSCSEDNGESAKAPEFPEKKSISCNAGETKEFTFDANLDWRLTSNAIWCKLEKDGTEDVTVSGSAGTQTVMIKVTDSEQTTGEASVAELELAMGGQTSVIAEITRSAKGYELKIYDMEGNEIEQLEVGYNTYIPFKVKANFRFAAKDFPDWISLKDGSLVGVPDEEVESGLQIVNDENREKYPVEASDENVITFADEAGKASFSFPVYYKGMDANAIVISSPTSNSSNWTVSLDGKTFTQKSGGISGTESSTTFQDKLEFTIKALQDDYEIVFIEIRNNSLQLMDKENAWMHCGKDKGNVTLTVDPLDTSEKTERNGYVLALSRSQYKEIENNLEENLIDGNEIAYKYGQNNLVIEFTQKEIEEISEGQFFEVKYSTGQQSAIECTLYEGEKSDHYKSTYKVNGISQFQVPEEERILVTVAFNISSFKSYYVENESEVSDNEFATMELENQIAINPEKAEGKDIFIVVKGENESEAAMLIVKAYKNDGTQKFIIIGGSNATKYNGTNANTLKTKYGLTEIYETKSNGDIVDIKMQPSPITNFEVYDLTENNEGVKIENSTDVTWGFDNMGNEEIGKIEVYFGAFGDIQDKTILVVAICENGDKYGIIASKA